MGQFQQLGKGFLPHCPSAMHRLLCHSRRILVSFSISLRTKCARICLTSSYTAGGVPRFSLRTDEHGVFHHTLSCLDRDPVSQRETNENFALVLVNYKLPKPLLEPLWRNASVRICADGAINRLYKTFDDDETRSKFIPEYLRGYGSRTCHAGDDAYSQRCMTNIFARLHVPSFPLYKCLFFGFFVGTWILWRTPCARTTRARELRSCKTAIQTQQIFKNA
jgi:hypothetical protein